MSTIKIKKVNTSYDNKKARMNYEIIEKWTAGIALKGWEVKCLDNHGGDINFAYCRFNKNNQLCLINCKISPISHEYIQQITSKDMLADRVLLLNKSELRKIKEHLDLKGLTCVPIHLERNKEYLWKITIAVVKSKKNYDKRNDIKERDNKRFEQRQLI